MSSGSNNKAPINVTQPSTSGKGRVDLVKSDFDAAIVQKGYDVYLDKVLYCPCRRKGDNQALSSCKNCGGSGYVYINRYKTKMILQSMNIDTKFKEWSAENIGTVKITARDEENLAYMDRISVIGAEVMTAQTIHPIEYGGEMRGKVIYDIASIDEIFAFVDDGTKLKKLELNIDYTYVNNIIIFDNQYLQGWDNFTVSIRYSHAPTFHIVDMVRETMTTKIKVPGSAERDVVMPIHAVGRRSHYVLDEQNYSGDYLLDNSYDHNGCGADKDEIIPPPTNFHVYHFPVSGIILNWIDPSNEETNFVIERSGIDGKWNQITITTPNTTTYTDTNIVVGEIYFYRIATRVSTKQSIWSGILGIKVSPNFVCSPANVSNSDGSLDIDVASGGSLVLNDVNHTQTDGSTESLPMGTALVCDPPGPGAIAPIRPKLYQTQSWMNYDEKWHIDNGTFDYVYTSTDIVQMIDPVTPDKVFHDDSSVTGISQHLFRFIGAAGGYYDESDGTYRDIDGNLSTRDTEFLLSGSYYIIDRLTWCGYRGTRGGSASLSAHLSIAPFTFSGFNDFYIPPIWYLKSLIRTDINLQLYLSDRPPFDIQLTLWSCTLGYTGTSSAWFFGTNGYTQPVANTGARAGNYIRVHNWGTDDSI